VQRQGEELHHIRRRPSGKGASGLLTEQLFDARKTTV
jgi:hypothetical protein